MKKEIDDYDYTVNALLTQLHTIQASFNRYHNKQALEGFMQALDSAARGSRNETTIDGILSYLLAIKDRSALNNDDIRISKQEKANYIKILSGVKGRDAKEVSLYIESLDTIE